MTKISITNNETHCGPPPPDKVHGTCLTSRILLFQIAYPTFNQEETTQNFQTFCKIARQYSYMHHDHERQVLRSSSVEGDQRNTNKCNMESSIESLVCFFDMKAML